MPVSLARTWSSSSPITTNWTKLNYQFPDSNSLLSVSSIRIHVVWKVSCSIGAQPCNTGTSMHYLSLSTLTKSVDTPTLADRYCPCNTVPDCATQSAPMLHETFQTTWSLILDTDNKELESWNWNINKDKATVLQGRQVLTAC